MTSIRGAITARENSRVDILEASGMLVLAVMDANRVEPGEVIDILFTSTDDLTAANPAAAARGLGLTEAGLMGMAEMPVDGSLRRCIRLLMHVEQGKKQSDMNHVYLRGAAVLRPELACFAVAVDGPGGAGKSTVARMAAAALGMVYIDTGAMYRAVALYNMRQGTDLGDHAAVEQSLAAIDIEIRHDEGRQRLFLNGEDVTDDLRVQAVAEGSSIVAAYGAVRLKMAALQRWLALTRRVVMDGRDIGTNVLPWAQVKVYLDASLDVRVARRIRELTEKGEPADFETVRHEIKIRDERDMNRAFSPLTQAEDAVYIDTSGLQIEEVVDRIRSLVKEKEL